MRREVVTCEGCGQPYSVRVRDDGTFVLPTETGECDRCGGNQFSQVVDEITGDD
ncbi:hypothetical protein [Haladaptatus halobius]|uniref:hypothetical protein n=1 Tax=Haladaptatus halobius TaxID=2884875 RepID=UPI001D09DFDA|nr:hypothetical protein [Haladaptatus halobius]